jgi:hypothetical protein
VNPALIIPLYVVGAAVAMYLAQARGYWWPIGLAVGLVSGPLAPVVMFILPNRRAKRSAS